MNEYELAVLLHPDLEIDQQKPLAKIDKLLEAIKAKVISRDDWGKRRLAYPIKKQQFALYFFYKLEIASEGVAELERNLAITNEVLRYLIVKALPELETADGDAEVPEKTADDKADKPKTETKTATTIKKKPVAAKAEAATTSKE